MLCHWYAPAAELIICTYCHISLALFGLAFEYMAAYTRKACSQHLTLVILPSQSVAGAKYVTPSLVNRPNLPSAEPGLVNG